MFILVGIIFPCLHAGFGEASWEDFVKMRIRSGWDRYQKMIISNSREISLSELFKFYNNILLPKWIPNNVNLIKIYYYDKGYALLVYCDRYLNIPWDNIFLDSNFTIMIIQNYTSKPPISLEHAGEDEEILRLNRVLIHISRGKSYINYTIMHENKVVASGVIYVRRPISITFSYGGLMYIVYGYFDEEVMLRIVKSMISG